MESKVPKYSTLEYDEATFVIEWRRAAFFGAAASAAAAPSAPGSDSLRFERRIILSARVSRGFSAERAGRTEVRLLSLRWAGDCAISRGAEARNPSAQMRRRGEIAV